MRALERFEWFAKLDHVTCEEFAMALRGEFGPNMGEWLGKQLVEKELWNEALSLAFHKDPCIAFRASWALEWAYFHSRESFRPYVSAFVGNYLRADNPSVHRHYNKIMCDMIRHGLVTLDDSMLESVVEKAFDLLIDENTKSAVRVWSAEILFDLALRCEWVDNSLEDVLKQQMNTLSTPALVSHYRMLLKRMAKRRNSI